MQTKAKPAKAAPRKQPARRPGIPAQYLLEAGGLLRLPQVLSLVGVSKSTWWKMVREQRAPQGVKLAGGRSTAWRSEAIAELIQSAGNAEPQA